MSGDAPFRLKAEATRERFIHRQTRAYRLRGFRLQAEDQRGVGVTYA
jgi:hypothetical protein